MGIKSQDQVELSNLLFGMSWEDPSSDRRALAIKPGDTVTTISSGGCNTLTLLLDNPAPHDQDYAAGSLGAGS